MVGIIMQNPFSESVHEDLGYLSTLQNHSTDVVRQIVIYSLTLFFTSPP